MPALMSHVYSSIMHVPRLCALFCVVDSVHYTELTHYKKNSKS